MQIKLSSKEIAQIHQVSERTAFRWLRDADPRCFTEIQETKESIEERDKREGAERLRKYLDNLEKAAEAVYQWARFYDDYEAATRMKRPLKALWKAVDAVQRESGAYPEINWNEE
jgi:hypothetical protein